MSDAELPVARFVGQAGKGGGVMGLIDPGPPPKAREDGKTAAPDTNGTKRSLSASL